jgi:hypothetical protein
MSHAGRQRPWQHDLQNRTARPVSFGLLVTARRIHPNKLPPPGRRGCRSRFTPESGRRGRRPWLPTWAESRRRRKLNRDWTECEGPPNIPSDFRHIATEKERVRWQVVVVPVEDLAACAQRFRCGDGRAGLAAGLVRTEIPIPPPH